MSVVTLLRISNAEHIHCFDGTVDYTQNICHLI